MMKKLIPNTGVISITALSIFLNVQTAYAAPGTLATSPLFVATAVEPNIFLTLDDSGSMNWEHIYQWGVAGFTTSEGLPRVGNYYRYYWHPDWHTDSTIIPPAGYQHPNASVTWDENMWVMRNHNANKLFYNPSTNYEPWEGVDSAGNPLYKDAVPTAVLRDPNAPNGTVTDLTRSFNYYDYDGCRCWLRNSYYLPSYYTWTDDGDGVIEASDQHQLVQITSATTTYPSGRSYAEELQNFANWFQYYRKREYATKAAIGGVINNTDAARMGLDVFNDGHQEDVATMGAPSNKLQLLETFYSINSSGYTPARRALNRVGTLFQQTASTAPIFTASDGGECQQNFNILMSDGYWNGYFTGLGNADYSASNDGGFDGDQNESNDGGNYEDSASNTLADIAMHFYETDLRTDLANKVPTIEGTDEADHQHLVTYTISFGLTGLLDPETHDPLAAGFAWPNPHNNYIAKVDDMWHAAYNGRGKFLSTHSPEELESALNEAIQDIADRTATAASVAVTSAQLNTDSRVFISEFNTNRWQGTVFAYGIIEEKRATAGGGTNTVVSLTTDPLWDAGEKLDGRASPQTSRVILTYDNTSAAGSAKAGVAFEWDNLTTDMKNDLRTNASGGTDADSVAQARLNYLRGDRSNEGAGLQFRKRASLLGDIVHSAPAYIAKSNLPWPDTAPFPTGNTYSDFKESTADRKGVVYVGANDGMFHGFDEVTGEELLAYIPSYLFSSDRGAGLHYLTDPNYTHRYYNDLSPMITDAYLNGDWHTILVSGQGAGGRGYFMLDITDPSSFSQNNAAKIVLGEFDHNDDPDLGFTFSRPQVGMTNDGKFSVIFGNGYNDTGDGQAKLFILDIAAGADGSWSATDYREISTGVGSTTNRNGLSSPQLVDLDQNGTVDRVYAGDLFGNMWAFDLRDSSKTVWNTVSGSTPLFTTIGNRPITTKPAVSRHPTIDSAEGNYPNLMLTFGTGQYLVDADKTTTHDNYFYGVWDRGTSGLTSTNLMNQQYRTGFSVRVLDREPVDYSNQYGWYIDLPDSGERSISESQIRSGYVIFVTNVPTTDPCSTGGYGYLFILDLKNGGTPSIPIIDMDGDGDIDEQDYLYDPNTGAKDVQSAIKFDRFLNRPTLTQDHLVDDLKKPRLMQPQPNRETGRISWQELLKND